MVATHQFRSAHTLPIYALFEFDTAAIVAAADLLVDIAAKVAAADFVDIAAFFATAADVARRAASFAADVLRGAYALSIHALFSGLAACLVTAQFRGTACISTLDCPWQLTNALPVIAYSTRGTADAVTALSGYRTTSIAARDLHFRTLYLPESPPPHW